MDRSGAIGAHLASSTFNVNCSITQSLDLMTISRGTGRESLPSQAIQSSQATLGSLPPLCGTTFRLLPTTGHFEHIPGLVVISEAP
jgi:hypothetical protein